MIVDALANTARYACLHPDFQQGFAFLQRPDLSRLPDGRHDIAGERLFALVSRTGGRGRAAAKLEAHRRYIDIQYIVSGVDVIGWRELSTCVRPESEFSVANDCIFFTDPSELWLDLGAERFAIFFPQDAHAPLAGEGPVHKIVIKVAV